MKRLMDIVVSMVLLWCFLPIGVLIAIAISLETKGGIFYRQKRIGLKGKEFNLFKFRSMTSKSDAEGKLTIGNHDHRITKVGKIIRKFKLDEFPQFINVLKGDMSVVGPRPEVMEYVKLYDENQKKVLNFKPGITDIASITFFEENILLAKSPHPERTYIEEIMPEKIRLNLEYQVKANLISDLGIIFKTAIRILK